MKSSKLLVSGDVGYIATGLKDISLVRVGDTIVLESDYQKYSKGIAPLAGYKEPKPVVFLSIFPEDPSRFEDLSKAFDKLKLNDAALNFLPENAGSLGLGFRCGFLGLLHAEITQERLEREYGVNVFATTPSVSYRILLKGDEEIFVNSASNFPDPVKIEKVMEPYAEVFVFAPSKYLGNVMDLCDKNRGIFKNMKNLVAEETASVKLTYNMPLYELISGFYDQLKSVSSGYASLDYELGNYMEADVVCMDILVAGEKVGPLSRIVRRGEAAVVGRNLVRRLKEILPRQQFVVSLQAVIGGRIVARESISAARKDVLEGIYGGHRERKDKLLDRQKRGKKRLKQFGRVSIPQDVFWKLMR